MIALLLIDNFLLDSYEDSVKQAINSNKLLIVWNGIAKSRNFANTINCETYLKEYPKGIVVCVPYNNKMYYVGCFEISVSVNELGAAIQKTYMQLRKHR